MKLTIVFNDGTAQSSIDRLVDFITRLLDRWHLTAVLFCEPENGGDNETS